VTCNDPEYSHRHNPTIVTMTLQQLLVTTSRLIQAPSWRPWPCGPQQIPDMSGKNNRIGQCMRLVAARRHLPQQWWRPGASARPGTAGSCPRPPHWTLMCRGRMQSPGQGRSPEVSAPMVKGCHPAPAAAAEGAWLAEAARQEPLWPCLAPLVNCMSGWTQTRTTGVHWRRIRHARHTVRGRAVRQATKEDAPVA
jgi:hypothetical protein